MGESNDESAAGITCLLTVHGVGFQQPPGPPDGPGQSDRPGYADLLHQNLARFLPSLSDDPDRQPYQHGSTAPVYVQSNWPPRPGRQEQGREAGLQRLAGPLVVGGARIAHVALVYTGLEEAKADLPALLQTALLGLVRVGHYASAAAIVGGLFMDVSAALGREPRPAEGGADVSLRVRTDPLRPLRAMIASMPSANPSSVLLQVEDDVGAYVLRNERRELVRGFVHESLLRLLAREDVRSVVVNAHSQGTVVAYDVLRRLPEAAIAGVRAFVTAGSPLRKYATALSWGREVGRIQDIPTWLNVHDARDPVADGLRKPPRGRPAPDDPAPPGSLFWWRNPRTGLGEAARVEDLLVDNVRHSPPEALRAHNYWDNQAEFLPRLAEILSAAGR